MFLQLDIIIVIVIVVIIKKSPSICSILFCKTATLSGIFTQSGHTLNLPPHSKSSLLFLLDIIDVL
jgi:hypothetical protein